MTQITLCTFWRSSCAWRVRTALHFKGLQYCTNIVNIWAGDNKTEEYLARNPFGQVPTLVIDEEGKEPLALFQSMAILEYLEEAFPERMKLLPENPVDRARVRLICESIISGMHPYQSVAANIGLDDLKGPGSADEWSRNFLLKRFAALEAVLKESSGQFCLGDSISLADVCLLPQYYSGESRFKIDMTQFPVIHRICNKLLAIPEFSSGHPEKQPDFPGDKKDISKTTIYAVK